MSKHNISTAATLLAGNAYNPSYHKDELQNTRGLPMSLLAFVALGAPIVGDPNGICESQSINGAGALDGTLVTAGVGVMDVARALVGAWTGTAVVTVVGLDKYGEVISESSASGTSFTGKKAFMSVTAVSSSAAITGATIGTGDVIGLPFRIDDANQIIIRFGGAEDAATVVAADDTAATATTGDVRGTINPSGTLDGSTALGVWMVPASTQSNELAFGVTQFGG